MLCFLFEAWSCRCSCMGSMSVSSCRSCMFMSCVHHVAVLNAAFCMSFRLLMLVKDARGDHMEEAPNDTAYKRWSCHSGLKLLCKLCRTPPPPQWGPDLPFFGHAGHADPLDGWRCCSQKRVMSRPIQVRQL